MLVKAKHLMVVLFCGIQDVVSVKRRTRRPGSAVQNSMEAFLDVAMHGADDTSG
jgi:hypothetical protein